MWAMTRSGHDGEEEPSWESCLYVNLDFFRWLKVSDNGEDVRKG